MKDYNEMAKSVFTRRDEYLAEKKRKRAMLLKAGVPVCSLLLVSLVGIGIWMAKLPEIPSTPPSDQQNVTQNATEPIGLENDVTNYVPATQETVIANPSQGMQPSAPDSTQGNIQKPAVKPTKPSVGDIPQTNATKPQGDSPATSVKPLPTDGVNATVPGVPSTMPATSGGAVTPTEGVIPTLPMVPDTKPPATNNSGDPLAPPPTYAPCTTCAPTATFPPYVETTVPSSSPTVAPTTEAPTEPPTGPVEIKVADKTYTAQTGDMVTYTVELEAEERFEDIQAQIEYTKKKLEFVVPTEFAEYDYSAVIPNLPTGRVSYTDSKIKATDSDVSTGKIDFRNSKVLMTVNFIVARPGAAELDFNVLEMNIDIERQYFSGGRPVTAGGVTITQSLVITPKDQIVSGEEKPTSPSEPDVPPFEYPEESTDGDLLIHTDNRTYAADIGQKITFVVELEAEEKFEDVQMVLNYGKDVLELIVPEDDDDKGIYREDITAPNLPSLLINYNNYSNLQPYDLIKMCGSNLQRYDFRRRKVFLQFDFMVEEVGEVDMDLIIEYLTISYPRAYFSNGIPEVTEGINVYQYVLVE